jgi:ribosome-interacting GTPase 1
MIPKHKGTEKMQAMLKTKIAKCRSAAQKKSSSPKHGPLHAVRRSGAGQVVLVGPPNSGKSSLVKALTNGSPQVGDYPFTTLEPFPAMMKFENIQIQLIDFPPITPDFFEPWQADLIKTSDGSIILLDLAAPDLLDALPALFDRLGEKRIEFADGGRHPSMENSLFRKKALLVANKKDTPGADENLEMLKEFMDADFTIFPISAGTGDGLEDLKKKLFAMLHIVRIYSKIPGKKVNLQDPYTLKKGSTLMDLARLVHKDFCEKLKFARIWNRSKYQGQRVNRGYILEDEDTIELHI